MRVFASLAAAAAIFAAPLSVAAAATTTTYHTAYRQVQPTQTAGEVTGVMRLTFSPGGTVSGTYRDDFGSNQLYTVAGGVHGTRIWLSFATRVQARFHGTIEKNGTITGSLTNWHGPRVYRFTAVPATS